MRLETSFQCMRDFLRGSKTHFTVDWRDVERVKAKGKDDFTLFKHRTGRRMSDRFQHFRDFMSHLPRIREEKLTSSIVTIQLRHDFNFLSVVQNCVYCRWRWARRRGRRVYSCDWEHSMRESQLFSNSMWWLHSDQMWSIRSQLKVQNDISLISPNVLDEFLTCFYHFLTISTSVFTSTEWIHYHSH